jgi:hypothetical protein
LAAGVTEFNADAFVGFEIAEQAEQAAQGWGAPNHRTRVEQGTPTHLVLRGFLLDTNLKRIFSERDASAQRVASGGRTTVDIGRALSDATRDEVGLSGPSDAAQATGTVP